MHLYLASFKKLLCFQIQVYQFFFPHRSHFSSTNLRDQHHENTALRDRLACPVLQSPGGQVAAGTPSEGGVSPSLLLAAGGQNPPSELHARNRAGLGNVTFSRGGCDLVSGLPGDTGGETWLIPSKSVALTLSASQEFSTCQEVWVLEKRMLMNSSHGRGALKQG